MTIDRITMQVLGVRCLGSVMRDNLMTKKIEVNPLLRAASFRKAEYRAIEVSSGSKIINREGYMEGTQL